MKKSLSRRLLSMLLLLSVCALPIGSFGEESGMEVTDYDPLYTLAEPYGFRLGGCFGAWDMTNPDYMNFLVAHFNSLTCTNETKAYSLLNQFMSQTSEDGMPRMNFVTADKMVEFCRDRSIGVRGHVLVWDANMTTWFFHEGYDDSKPLADQETMRKRVASYIDQVITHFEEKYPGVIYCWDVVNEAIGDSELDWKAGDSRHLRTLRSGAANMFLDCVGEDYVEYSFLCARDTVERLGADIRLFYNDYNLFMPEKRAAALAMAESINSYAKDDGGNPRKLIDGIGMQGYMGGYGTQEGCLEDSLIVNMRESIAAYAAQGLEVQITEMAVRNYDKAQASKHAEFYGRLFTEAFIPANTEESKPLTAVCIWGLADCPQLPQDNYTWKLNSPYGGLVTEKIRVKTSFDAVYTALLEGDI